MWRTILIALLLVVAVAVVWSIRSGEQIVETAPAVRGPISSYVEERARTRLPRTYRITTPIAGRVMPIELVEGDVVQAGQVVAQLEMADLETSVAMSRARVERLEARVVENNDVRLETSTLEELASFLESVDRSVEAALAKTESSQARERFHESDLVRKREAFGHDSATRREVDEAELAELESQVEHRTDVLSLRALEAVREAVQIWPVQVRQVIEKKALTEAALQHELAEAEAALAQAVRDRERAAIRTPVAGVVLARHVANERVLPAGADLLEIGRLEDLEVEIEVLSEDALRMEVGDPVDVMVAPDRAPLPARVQRIEPRGYTKVSSLGVEEQRVVVIAAFDEASRSGLGVGYRVRVRIHTEDREQTMVVPRSALVRGTAGQWQVFAVRGGRAHLVDVEVGLRNDREVEILDGLTSDDVVILAPGVELRDGGRVRLADG